MRFDLPKRIKDHLPAN
jgi:hypothetical protein